MFLCFIVFYFFLFLLFLFCLVFNFLFFSFLFRCRSPEGVLAPFLRFSPLTHGRPGRRHFAHLCQPRSTVRVSRGAGVPPSGPNSLPQMRGRGGWLLLTPPCKLFAYHILLFLFFSFLFIFITFYLFECLRGCHWVPHGRGASLPQWQSLR